MIIEQHYDEEVLIGLLEEAEHDTHVPGCETCAGTLESLRDLTGALRDDSVWDERVLSESPSTQTSNMLRAFAQRAKVEDAEAATIAPKLIATPSMIQAHPEWRTAGVVRRLLTVVDEKNFSDPKLAADLAALAVEVAESLDATQYPHDTVMKLRAMAWGEHGYALYFIDLYQQSLEAFDKSDEFLRRCSVADFESAEVALHRAQVFGILEQIESALTLAGRAREVFRRHGAARREAAADATIATLLMRVRRFAEALPIHQRIAADQRIDATSRALALHNAAICLGELSRLEEAKRSFVQAISEFERLQIGSMRSRSRWLFARILLSEGAWEKALPVFEAVRSEFAEADLFHEVALVSVDIAENLLMLGRGLEVIPFCQQAMDYFAKAGLAYTAGALTALAYLTEAAQAQTLTRTALRHVRGYFEVLPKQPQLLFAYPT